MVNLILRFVSSSRAAGMRISTSEVLDCLRHLAWIDPLEEPQFQSVLRANFAKSRREQAHFERLYHLFFHELRQDISIARSPALADQIQSLLHSLSPSDAIRPSMRVLFDFLSGDPAGLLEWIRSSGAGENGRGSGEAVGAGAASRRRQLLEQIDTLGNRLAQLVAGRRDDLGWEERSDLAAHFQDRLDAVRRLLSEPAADRPGHAESRRSFRHLADDLGAMHFASLTPREVEAMRETVEQLVRRLKDQIGRRYAARNRGVLDIKKTLRRAAAYQGVPIEACFRNRPPRKAKIVTLCDVSGSVWSAARFMLNMLYSLQECFTQVRSFIFVAGLEEVTEVFKRHEINLAIDKILKEAGIDYNAATDYGKTFREFKRRYMDILNRQTTVIVIGDGRSNYTNPEERILEEMRERSRRLIWLNPETPQFWYTGDSEMRVFQTVCDEVRPCQNLNQLLAFITSLVL
jgi:uncharacterized protein with von Willebrand factor type A (vWA) domain